MASDGNASTPTIDGRFHGAAEGYSNGWSVDLVSEGGTSYGGGEIWAHEEGGIISAALILPLSLKDNTYGTTETFGYKGDPTKQQQFKDLTGSDRR